MSIMLRGLFVGGATLPLLALVPMSASAATISCLGGATSHTATQQEADSVPSGGITAGVTQVCPNDARLGINNTTGAAKESLETMWCGGRAASCSYNGKTYTSSISGLDNNFAVCADKFMKALRQQDSTACIRSAYRSTDHQVCACGGNANGVRGKCAPAGRSYHQKGLAIDVTNRIDKQKFWDIAAQSGLANPAGLHTSDPNHLQPLGGSSNCSGSPVPQSDTSDLYSKSGLPFDNSLRNALGMQPPPPPPAQSLAPAQPTATTPIGTPAATPPAIGTINSTPYTAGTCTPQTYCSQSDGNIYYRATTCIDQIYQRCSKGCTGLICNATSTQATGGSILDNLLNQPTDTGQNQNTGGGSAGTSTFDLIDFFANPPAGTTSIGTAVPIDISQSIQDTGNAAVLGPPGSAGQPASSPPGTLSPYGPVPQQTFTSSDLANSPTYDVRQNSTFQRALANMRATLLTILQYLQPFGGIRVQNATFTE